jgi:hypothetical protein
MQDLFRHAAMLKRDWQEHNSILTSTLREAIETFREHWMAALHARFTSIGRKTSHVLVSRLHHSAFEFVDHCACSHYPVPFTASRACNTLR